MATQAFTAQGSRIFINEIKIGEAKTYEGPNSEAPEVDATHLESEAEEFVAGLPGKGEFTVTCNEIVDDPGQIECERLFVRRLTGRVRINYKNDTLIQSFDVAVKSFNRSAETNAVKVVEIAFAVSGGYERTPALPA